MTRILMGWLVVCLAVVAVPAEPARAQEATPFALPTTPAAADCPGEPLTLAAVEAVLATATPAPETDVGSEAELPTGEPADAATTAAITAGEHAFAACYNAGDWPRILGLLTVDALVSVVAEIDPADLFATAGTPEADDDGPVEIVLVAARDVRVLPDGRVGAVVEWGREREGQSGTIVDEANFRIWEWGGDRWLLDEEIGSFTPWHQADGTPPVWQSDATPPA